MERPLLPEMDRLMEEYEMIPPGSVVLCAVSGGADSVCLLHRLSCLRARKNFRLVCAHYNHRLRGEESRRDEAFVRDFTGRYCCGENGLPPVSLVAGAGDVREEAARRKKGIEETAREMRYAFLQEAARREGATAIATAHNAGDNMETVLLHLLRGAGLQGLSGIQPRRDPYIRPLLTTSREEIEAYLDRWSLPHVEDSTNAGDAYARNRIRHRLLPLMEELSPGFTGRFPETIRRLREDNDFLNDSANRLLSRYGTGSGKSGGVRIEAARIAEAGGPVAVRAVRGLIAEAGGTADCSAVHLKSVIALCRSPNPSARVSLPRGLTATRENQDLVLIRDPVSGPLAAVPLNLRGVTRLENSPVDCLCARAVCPPERAERTGYLWYLRLDALGPEAVVRSRRTGDSITLPGRGTRSLKKLLINEKIPRRLRDRIPVLSDERGVIGAAGVGCDASRQAAPGEMSWRISFPRKSDAFPEAFPIKYTEKDGKVL